MDPVLTCLRGSIAIGSTGESVGESNFGSVGVPWSSLTKGRWYYEVEILTDDGNMQVGWANTLFMGDDKNGDGVGDDSHSWSYDGARGKAWHGGDAGNSSGHTEYGGQQRWKIGDVVGCMLDVDTGLISYALNGISLGVAFDSVGVGSDRLNTFYPACSLESNQSLRFNLGQQPFMFDEMTTMSEGSFVSVWDSRPREDQQYEEITVMEEVVESQRHVVEVNAEIATKAVGSAVAAVAATNATATTVTKTGVTTPVDEVEQLGMEKLKELLQNRSVKCGGTLQERAERYRTIRELSDEQIPKQLRAKKRRPRKN